MIIDFKEIPSGNEGGEGQDQFELFARDFLQEIGFDIIQHPSRGPDGKKDMLVFGAFNAHNTKIRWLVSCKHHAHSKQFRAVNDSDEINILERVKSNQCKGFIGFYSTIAATSLSNLLLHLKPQIASQIFDHRLIEKYIVGDSKLHDVFWRYFTNSFENHKQYLNGKNNSMNSMNSLNEADLLRINKTALIIVEAIKIRERYFDADWDRRGAIIDELRKYSDHTNLEVADYVFEFLSFAADGARGGMTQDVAISIYSLTINFFPYSEDDRDRGRIISLGKQSANSAYALVYDAAIYLMNYEIVMWGLTIMKYIYKKGKEQNYPELMQKVDELYDELERTVQRPERQDLGLMLELIRTFKKDRKEGTLVFPVVSERLMKVLH